MTIQGKTKKKSKRFLFLLFIIALPVFVFIRWDSNAWLAEKVADVTQDLSYNISYQDIYISGLGIGFTDLQISKTDNLNMRFDALHASLSLTSLLSGDLAADITASWENNPISFTVLQGGDILQIMDIQASLDMARLEALQLNIPAQLSGMMQTSGNISIDTVKLLPQKLDLHLSWDQAMAGLAQPEFTLGDYTAQISGNDDTNQPWQWSIAGGSGVTLSGNGSIISLNPDPNYWALNGSIEVKVDQTNPALAMMLQAITGSNQANIRLSGTLSNPKTDFIH